MPLSSFENMEVYKYVTGNFIDKNEDFQIYEIKKVYYGKSHKEAYFLVAGCIIPDDGPLAEMRLKIYRDDVYYSDC